MNSSSIFASPPPGAAPSLARLAYNRLSFGPRPEDLAQLGAFDLTAFVDQQLAIESIDDSACDAAINALPRIDPKGITIPPLNAPMREMVAYDDAVNAANGYAPGHLQDMLVTTTYGRGLLSKRQLYELMVDFWTNHFQTDSHTIAKYWEDNHVIRRHALGNFRDLLGASAKSPATIMPYCFMARKSTCICVE